LTIRFVDLGRQYSSIKAEIDHALIETAASTQYILGEEVERFEGEFAAYCGTSFCVGVGSGTAAIQLALEGLGISQGDEVIVPANTFIGSVLPVLRLGAMPVLVDCDEATATIDPELAAAAVGPRTKAVIAVHLYGQPGDIAPLQELCASRGLALIEDACQAHGARYRGHVVGGLGAAAAFSFYPAKNLGAFGDAGAVTTDDEGLANRIRRLRDFGRTDKYVHVIEGGNERLDTIQAAVLRVKLRHLDGWNARRRASAAEYGRALARSTLRLPQTAAWAEHVWHLYVVRTVERDAIRAALGAQGIETGLHYPLPLPFQPALAQLGHVRGEFPVTERWADEVLSLPMFPELESDEIALIGEVIADCESAAARSVSGFSGASSGEESGR
jgi:dTDP-4-amino-4,6-dideoxygalactose transaminase